VRGASFDQHERAASNPHLFSLIAHPQRRKKKFLYSTASNNSSAAAMEIAQQSHDVMAADAGCNVFFEATGFDTIFPRLSR